MAEIYKAKLEGIGGFQRTFAIKRILPNFSQNADYIAMLVDEAKVAGLLSHANIVQILDLGQVDGVWYIAMEYVHGRDLGAVLRRARDKGLCLPVPHAVFIAIELLKGLEYAHQRQVMRGGRPVALNIIHRDVSPPNILLSYQGEVKLTDFGIARASLKVMETVTGVIKGRFDYMSPEQAGGAKDLDQRSDLFTVGVVLYEMLCGQHPFRSGNELATVEKVRTGRYTPISQVNPEVPFSLETIVDRALRVDRDERYPSATAFKEALDKFFHDAGFIFTHATLASYVKGLFPEGDGRSLPPAPPRSARAPATDPVTEPDSDLSLGADEPTGKVDRARLQQLGGASLGLQSSDFPDDWDDEDEAETVIRKVPSQALQDQRVPRTPTGRGGFGPDDPTAIRSHKSFGFETSSPELSLDFADEEDPETLIRSAPAGFDDDPPTRIRDRRPAADSSAEIDLVDGFSIQSDPTKVRNTRPGKGTTTGAIRRRRAGVGFLGWVLAACMLVIGLLAGTAGTAATAWLLGALLTSGPDAHLVVDAPKGTMILLDGESVPGDLPIEPGPHRLEIHVRGRGPIVREFDASPGEHHVFLVEQVE